MPPIHTPAPPSLTRRLAPLRPFLLVLSLFFAVVFSPTPSRAQDPAPTAAPASEASAAPDQSEANMTIVRQTMQGNVVTTVARFNSISDSYIASALPNTNFGSSNTLFLGWNQGNQQAMRILIQFNVSSIPSNANVTRATYNIYQFNASPSNDGNMDFRAQYMQSNWQEMQVTWNNANFLGGASLPLGTIDSSPGWKTGSALGVVQAWVSGAQPNRGLILTGDETPSRNRFRQFYSREQPGFVPFLEVEWSATCDTLPPVVTVEAQPQFQPESFRVRWNGQDQAPSNCEPTGIASFDVQYRINGGNWVNWRNQTQSTASTFSFASNGQFVEFRARGRDNAGNVQSWSGSQASTTVDTEPPTSSFTPLPEFTVSENFFVNWSGSDNLSGVAYYDVQWRTPNGEWQWLAEQTTATSYHVTGAQNGVTYQGRIRAVDNVGNAQPWPSSPQVQTTVFAYAIADILPFNPNVIKPTAPITTSFNVAWTGFFAPGTSIVSYSIFFNYERRGWQLWITVPGNQTSATFDWRNLGMGDGLYEFEATATNNLGATEPRNFTSEAAVIVDMADAFQPQQYMPIIFTQSQ